MDRQKNQRIRVLFVCLGNICRSPTAEAVFNKLLKQDNLQDKIECESAGTSSLHEGDFPDPRTISAGKRRGLEFLTTSQPFKKQHFEDFDYIVVMDESNFKNVMRLDPENKHLSKVSLMLSHAPDIKIKSVPDPYYGGDKGFEEVIDLLEVSCLSLLNQIKQKLN